jgi:hypothetical protein
VRAINQRRRPVQVTDSKEGRSFMIDSVAVKDVLKRGKFELCAASIDIVLLARWPMSFSEIQSTR